VISVTPIITALKLSIVTISRYVSLLAQPRSIFKLDGLFHLRFLTYPPSFYALLEQYSEFFGDAIIICREGFNSASRANPSLQMHAHEQKVNCPGCHKVFNRAGGLMSHIEYKECIILKPGLIEELRANNPLSSGQFDAIKAATSWGATANLQLGHDNSSGSSSRYASGGSVGPADHTKAAAPVDPFLKNFVREQATVEHVVGEKGIEQAVGKASSSSKSLNNFD
jgi:hypothetical protein